MPQYMLLIYEDPTSSPAPDSPQAMAEFGEYGAFTRGRPQRAGAVRRPARRCRRPTPPRPSASTATAATPFSATARSPRRRSGSAGYYLLDCPDLDTATAQAARIPAARHGAIEVRPVMEIPGM